MISITEPLIIVIVCSHQQDKIGGLDFLNEIITPEYQYIVNEICRLWSLVG